MMVPDGYGSFLGYLPPEWFNLDSNQVSLGAFADSKGNVVYGVGDAGGDNFDQFYLPDEIASVTISNLSSGDRGIRETLHSMKDLALKGARTPEIIQLSRLIVAGPDPSQHCDTHDQRCEAKRILGWIQQNIRWTPDIGDAETLMGPWRLLELGAGDCDDLSILASSLAISIGLPVRFKAIAADPGQPNDFTHVYVEFKVNGKWIPADPSVDWAHLGWESPIIEKEMHETVFDY